MNPDLLRSRLRSVIHGPAALPGASHAAPAPQTPARAGNLHESLGGAWHQRGSHRSFVVRRTYAAGERYGVCRVGDIAEAIASSSHVAPLFGGAAAPPFVFFDLETTGLHGGAGTYAFLVGCATFDASGALSIEQHLMVDHQAERGMLAVVADGLGAAGALVTYNGKSFDAPLVETRFLFHRDESPCAGKPHIDVLHPARRFWGTASQDGCSLTTLETQVLRVRRIGDVAGAEVPARYFHFVRSGDARPLAPVLEHNRLDLITLAGLTARLFTLADRGAAATASAYEAAALGFVYERAEQIDRAEEAYVRAVALSSSTLASSRVRVDALRALAHIARRARRYAAAAERWKQVLQESRCPAAIAQEANEALAIHHEHRVRDLKTARAFALKGLALNAKPAKDDAARHRLARIERKMVSERRPLFPSSPWPPSSGSPPSASRTSS